MPSALAVMECVQDMANIAQTIAQESVNKVPARLVCVCVSVDYREIVIA